MTWWIECSMGGARELGTGLRYIEMMVIPFENCSTYFRAELQSTTSTLISTLPHTHPEPPSITH